MKFLLWVGIICVLFLLVGCSKQNIQELAASPEMTKELANAPTMVKLLGRGPSKEPPLLSCPSCSFCHNNEAHVGKCVDASCGFPSVWDCSDLGATCEMSSGKAACVAKCQSDTDCTRCGNDYLHKGVCTNGVCTNTVSRDCDKELEENCRLEGGECRGTCRGTANGARCVEIDPEDVGTYCDKDSDCNICDGSSASTGTCEKKTEGYSECKWSKRLDCPEFGQTCMFRDGQPTCATRCNRDFDCNSCDGTIATSGICKNSQCVSLTSIDCDEYKQSCEVVGGKSGCKGTALPPAEPGQKASEPTPSPSSSPYYTCTPEESNACAKKSTCEGKVATYYACSKHQCIIAGSTDCSMRDGKSCSMQPDRSGNLLPKCG